MTRIEREIANPDAALVEAMREVDAMLPGSPPIAPRKAAPPPTLVGGNSAWRAPPPLHDPAARLHDPNGGAPPPSAEDVYRVNAGRALAAVAERPWFAPYVCLRTHAEHEECWVLQERFGGAIVSRAWLELHRYDIVQAMRRL